MRTLPCQRPAHYPKPRLPRTLRPRVESPLRSAREAAGLSQNQLAAALGMNGAAVSKWERGDAYPHPPIAFRISELLGIPLEAVYALARKGDPAVDLLCRRIQQTAAGIVREHFARVPIEKMAARCRLVEERIPPISRPEA